MFRQMEKLIKLLNEYEMNVVKQSYMYPVYRRDEKNKKILNLYIGFNTEEELKYKWLLSYIVSLEYGFIKWLVENEKIEGEKFQEPKIRGIIGLISNWHNSEGKSYKDYSKELAYESLLMLLSIQDEPIEFLISIIK